MPACGASLVLVVMTPVLAVHDAVPLSKPGLARICVLPPPPVVTFRVTVVVWVLPPPVAVTVTV